MSKKAISPLLSTILLLVFAASLGAVVISWGSSQSALAIYPTSCKATDLEIVKLNDIDQICYVDGKLEFTIKNVGETKIESIKIDILGEDRFYNEVIEEGMDPSDIIRKTVYYDAKIGSLQKVFIVPKIQENNIVKFCPREGIEAEDIFPC